MTKLDIEKRYRAAVTQIRRRRPDPFSEIIENTVRDPDRHQNATTAGGRSYREGSIQMWRNVEIKKYTLTLTGVSISSAPLSSSSAAIRAGYSAKTAKVTGAKLLTKANLRAYIDEQLDRCRHQSSNPLFFERLAKGRGQNCQNNSLTLTVGKGYDLKSDPFSEISEKGSKKLFDKFVGKYNKPIAQI